MDSERRGLDPADALGFALPPRPELADKLVTPPWYHPAGGLALALVVGSWGSHSLAVVGVATVLWLVALGTLPRLYRRATGVWVTGALPPGTRRWARALSCTSFGGLVVGILVGSLDGPARLLSVVAALVAFGLVQVLGRRFDDALREGLRDDPEIAFKIEEADS